METAHGWVLVIGTPTTRLEVGEALQQLAVGAGPVGHAVVDTTQPVDSRYVMALGMAIHVAEVAAARPAIDAGALDRFLADPQSNIVFQPVVSFAEGEAVSHEILARPEEHDIGDLVSVAVASRRGSDLDLVLSGLIFDRLRELHARTSLALNLLPASLVHPAFSADELTRRCLEAGVRPEALTIEVTEQAAVDEPELLRQRLRALRAAGFGVAVDDAGAGYASFALIANLRPSAIKIDRDIVAGIDTDDSRQALVEAFVSFSRRIGARLVAEGVSSEGELRELIALGVRFGQGYFLGRPAPRIETTSVRVAERCRSISAAFGQRSAGARIGDLAVPAVSYAADVTAALGRDRFLIESELRSLVLVDGLNRPVGVVSRDRLMARLAEGTSLHQSILLKRPLHQLADEHLRLVEAEASLHTVGQLVATSDDGALLHDLVVVGRDGRLAGVVRMRDLVRAISLLFTDVAAPQPLLGPTSRSA
jgi:EAL domain-containing protein (putative c-di-GMP-specific phosphodiesterase class I)